MHMQAEELTDDTPRGYHTYMRKEIKNKVLRRLSIIEGQLRGVRRMVEEERYCVDVITQTEAVKNALSGVENALLEKHLSKHVVEEMKAQSTVSRQTSQSTVHKKPNREMSLCFRRF